MNNYECFWRGKRMTVQATTSLAAQTIAAKQWRVKKQYEVTVVLIDKPIEGASL